MLRPFLIAVLLSPALVAQAPEQRLKDAWAHYLQYNILGGPAEDPQSGLGEAMDELGRAWAAWVEWHGSGAVPLPDPMNFRRSDDPDTLAPPVNRVLAHRGAWRLMGLEVPAPCGSHLFVALFKAEGARWTLVMLDLHEPRNGGDPLGARENAQVLLLDGPKVVIASTPPWCTSCWSALHVRALAPGTDPTRPTLLAHFQDGVNRCADEGAYQMTPTEGGVDLRYEGSASDAQIEAGQTTAPHRKVLRIP